MIRALAESGRISNLPTVWTNVLVGAALAGWAGAGPTMILPALAAGSLLYLGGMLLNDAIDADWDRAHNKARPITQGRLNRSTVYALSAACLLAGIAIPASRPAPGRWHAALFALALAACIILYNALHKRSASAAVFMAGCRALLYPLAAAMTAGEPGPPVWTASAAIGVYTILLTLAARREDIAGARAGGIWSWLVPVPFLVAAAALRPDRLVCVVFAGAGFLAWSTLAAKHATRGHIPAAVTGWISGYCLADALLLTAMGRVDFALLAALGWGLTAVSHRWISGT